jgi:hypothetical protein
LKKLCSVLRNQFPSTPLFFVTLAMELVQNLARARRFVIFVAVPVKFRLRFDLCWAPLSLQALAVLAAAMGTSFRNLV